tara:strand:- start:5583 stop:5891 length:309 start_codon:yes stop_codon:yes gene_type:complete
MIQALGTSVERLVPFADNLVWEQCRHDCNILLSPDQEIAIRSTCCEEVASIYAEVAMPTMLLGHQAFQGKRVDDRQLEVGGEVSRSHQAYLPKLFAEDVVWR